MPPRRFWRRDFLHFLDPHPVPGTPERFSRDLHFPLCLLEVAQRTRTSRRMFRRNSRRAHLRAEEAEEGIRNQLPPWSSHDRDSIEVLRLECTQFPPESTFVGTHLGLEIWQASLNSFTNVVVFIIRAQNDDVPLLDKSLSSAGLDRLTVRRHRLALERVPTIGLSTLLRVAIFLTGLLIVV